MELKPAAGCINHIHSQTLTDLDMHSPGKGHCAAQLEYFLLEMQSNLEQRNCHLGVCNSTRALEIALLFQFIPKYLIHELYCAFLLCLEMKI